MAGAELKTANIQLRVTPGLKALAEAGAAKEHRTLTNWIELLILTRCKELSVETPTPKPQETEA